MGRIGKDADPDGMCPLGHQCLSYGITHGIKSRHTPSQANACKRAASN